MAAERLLPYLAGWTLSILPSILKNAGIPYVVFFIFSESEYG